MLDIWIMASNPTRLDWLSRAIRGSHSIRLSGTATTYPLLRSLMAQTTGDVAIVDLQRGTQGAIVREWLDELTDIAGVLLLASEPDADAFNHILKTGTGGILQSDAESEQIFHAIESVAAGLVVMDAAVMPHRSDEDSPVEPLTPRENQVLHLLADGLGNKEIAVRLNISEHTIKFHIRSILGKLGVSSRTEAVSRGLRNGLIEL